MMILRSSPASPFGRKVKIVAGLLGLLDRIEVVTTDTNSPDDPLRKDNPLGKIPTLVTDDGVAIYDSRVIVDYLDMLAGGDKVIPADPKSRIEVLTLLALADGISDASLLIVYEGRYRPVEKHVASWTDHQAGKVKRGLDYLENRLKPVDSMPNVGQISAACALGYQDLRFGGHWRGDYPKLVAWLDDFEAKVPMYAKTRVTPT